MRKGRTQSSSNKAITRSQTRHRAVLTQHSQVKIALSRITLTVRCHHPPMKGRARETSRTRRPLTMTKFALWAQQSVAPALAGPHIHSSRRTRAHGRRLKRLSPIHHISAPARAQNGVWTQAKSVPSATSSQASWDDASQTTPPEESNWFWRLLRLGLWTRARARLDSAAPPGPVGARRQPLQASTYMLGDEIRSGITARPYASKSAVQCRVQQKRSAEFSLLCGGAAAPTAKPVPRSQTYAMIDTAALNLKTTEVVEVSARFKSTAEKLGKKETRVVGGTPGVGVCVRVGKEQTGCHRVGCKTCPLLVVSDD